MAVSVDLPKDAEVTAEDNELGFTLLADPDRRLIKQYNLEDQHPRRGPIFYPATLVISTDGRLTYSFASKDKKERAPVSDILAAIKDLQ